MTGRFEKQYGSYLTYIAEWSATANVAGNYSTVVVDLFLKHKAISLSPKAISCTVNGQTKIGNSPQLSQSSTSYYTTSKLASFSFTVNHSADGSMSCAFSSNWDCKITYSGIYYGTMTVSGTITGDKIPRASTISSLTSSVEVNGTNKVSLSLSRAVATYTHTVKFSIGSKSKTITGVGTSTSYAIPVDWLEAIPNATSGSVLCSVTTYDGSRTVGSVSKSFTITCPASIVPSMDAPIIERIDNNVPASWNIYLQNVSGVKISANNAQGAYGSTIKEYLISCAGFSTTTSALTISKIPNSGTVEYTVTAKDSRGRTVTKTGSITVDRYDSPVVSSLSVFRCDALGNKLEKGTYLSVTANVTFTVINGQNVPEIVCYVSEQGGGEIYSQVIENGTPAIISNISTDRAYDIRVVATDMFSSGERFGMISTTRYYLHFKRGGGLGVAFGKAAEKDGVVEFDENLTVEINGSAFLKGNEIAAIEYGTWTPELCDTSTGEKISYTTSSKYGLYFKVGKAVYVSFEMRKIVISSAQSSNQRAGVKGLPFPMIASKIFSASIGNRFSVFQQTQEEFFATFADQYIRFSLTQGGDTARFAATSNGYLYISGWYLID